MSLFIKSYFSSHSLHMFSFGSLNIFIIPDLVIIVHYLSHLRSLTIDYSYSIVDPQANRTFPCF